MYMIISRKQRFSIHELHKNATNRPHIYGGRVVRRVQQYLWCPIPSRDNIFRHKLILGGRSSETKVTNLKITISIQQEVAGFQISMNDIGRMYVLQSSKNLIQEILHTTQQNEIKSTCTHIYTQTLYLPKQIKLSWDSLHFSPMFIENIGEKDAN